MKYRLAKEEDLERICEFVRNAIVTMEKHNIFQWDDLYPIREDFLEDIKKGELFVGLLEDDIAVIYTLNGESDEEYQNGKWKNPDCEYRVIHRLCVNPKYQNQGLAKATLLHIEEELRKRNVGAIRLDVFSQNPFALALYTNNGYEQTGFVDWRKGRFYLMEKYL